MSEEIDIGKRIRRRRKEIGLSLREVARRADITASFLSQVERNQSNVSIDSLRRIAEALSVPVLYFLSEHSTPADTRAKQAVVVRSGYRPRLDFPSNKVFYELLTPDLNRQMEAIRGRLAPGSGNVARRLSAPTEEFIYVLTGALLIGVGDEEHILHPGDSIYFEGVQLKRLECASEHEDVIWLSIITPPVF